MKFLELSVQIICVKNKQLSLEKIRKVILCLKQRQTRLKANVTQTMYPSNTNCRRKPPFFDISEYRKMAAVGTQYVQIAKKVDITENFRKSSQNSS